MSGMPTCVTEKRLRETETHAELLLVGTKGWASA